MNLLRNTIIIFLWLIITLALAFTVPLAAAMFMLTTAITLILRPGLVRIAFGMDRRPNPRSTGGSSTVGEIRGQTGVNVIGNNNTITVNHINQPASDGVRYTDGGWVIGPGQMIMMPPDATFGRTDGGQWVPKGNPYDPDFGPGWRELADNRDAIIRIYSGGGVGSMETSEQRREREWLAGKDIVDAAKNIVIPGDRPRLDARLHTQHPEMECAICGVEFIDHAYADHPWEEIQEAGFENET
jgi:hypothetical protein